MIAAVVGSIVGYICTIFVDAADTGTIQLAAIPILPIVEAAVLSVGACLRATAMPLHSISKMNIVESIEMNKGRFAMNMKTFIEENVEKEIHAEAGTAFRPAG